MRSQGFRFGGPLIQSTDKEFEDLLNCPSNTYFNPWPQLADPTDLRYPWTHPIVLASYIGSTLHELNQVPLLVKDICASPYRWLAFLHETIHLSLSHTPARVLGGAISAEAFHDIYGLLAARGNWTKSCETHYLSLTRWNRLLSDLCSEIELAEELIATAFTFVGAERILRTRKVSKQFERMISRLERDFVASNDATMPEFQSLYKGFKRIARVVCEEESSTLKFSVLLALSAYLEPVTFVDSEFRSQPGLSRERCAGVAAHALQSSTTREIWDFVLNEMVRSHDGGGWKSLIDDCLNMDSQFSKDILRLTSPPFVWDTQADSNPEGQDLPSRFVAACLGYHPTIEQHDYGLAFVENKLRSVAYITPIWADTPSAWVFTSVVMGRPEKTGDPDIDYGSHTRLLIAEAFRQQLHAKMGIRCPRGAIIAGNRGTNFCACNDDWFKSVFGLFMFAREGRFGEGEWKGSFCPRILKTERVNSAKTDPFSAFSNRARRVLVAAEAETKRLKNSYIGTEHLLLALVQDAAENMNNTLSLFGLDPCLVQSVLGTFVTESNGNGDAPIMLGQDGKSAIQLAVDEARSLGLRYVGTPLLLLGLARQGTGIAARVLLELGCTSERLREEIGRRVVCLGDPLPSEWQIVFDSEWPGSIL